MGILGQLGAHASLKTSAQFFKKKHSKNASGHANRAIMLAQKMANFFTEICVSAAVGSRCET